MRLDASTTLPGYSRRRARRCSVLAVALTAACAGHGPPSLAPLLFPPPPDTARIQFLTRFSGAADFPGGGPSWVDRVTGRNVQRPQIQKPYGIGSQPGSLCITDTRLPGLVLVDLRRREVRPFQPADAQLMTPASCVPDPESGRLLVADVGLGRVLVFDSTRAYVTAFGAAEGAKPADIALDGDRVWVSDLGLHRIRAFDRRTYDLVGEFPAGQPGSAEYLAQPAHLAVAGGLVYVSDGLAFTIKVFDGNGRLQRTVGVHGQGPGQFARPKGIALDRDGNLYVVDASFQNVQIFDREGRLLTFFGGAYTGPGYLYLPVSVAVDYDNLEYFQRYVDQRFVLKHLIYVTNQFGPDKVTVYGFVEPRGGTASRP